MLPGRHTGNHRHGWCTRERIYLSEDNARFLMLVVILAFYLTMGTFIFYFLEFEQDANKRLEYMEFWQNFTNKYGGLIAQEDINQLVEASSLNYLPFQKKPKFDIYQSWYLAFSACGTIGFGHIVPTTPAARAVMIIYGLFGCSAFILFYNLFLERIITLLALVLRTIHEHKQRKKSILEGSTTSQSATRRNSTDTSSSLDSLTNWKPSVYWVMLCLFCLVCLIALSASALYSRMETWDYFTALYFSFVCFATVGFGDFVTAIEVDYGTGDVAYRLVNVVIIILGTSSLYSLFNVISIIIKHGLNFLIKLIDRKCCKLCCRRLHQAQDKLTGGYRRNAITSQSLSSHHMTSRSASNSARDASAPNDDHRYSSEENVMIDVREFLQANKVSLAVMQKDLHDSAKERGRTTVSAPSWHHSRHYNAHHRHSSGREDDDFKPSNIGPLAIVQHSLRDDD